MLDSTLVAPPLYVLNLLFYPLFLAFWADFFVDFLVSETLGVELADDPWGPAKEGFVTFVSFLLFGSVPMWVYSEYM